MKTTILTLSLAAALSAPAAIIVPGANGTDGALNITADTEIDLSLAPTGAWDNDNTPNAGKGVYDASKWAVVFKYTSVSVATGATVTFKNHASRAPVVWLVGGNVTINGTVKLDGQDGVNAPSPKLSEPGPGGFRGGMSWFAPSATQGGGFGFGGAKANGVTTDRPTGSSYGTLGDAAVDWGGGRTYGNESLVPLIGGSGGAGDNMSSPLPAGGAGGGALLLVSNSVSLNGRISANGGDGYTQDYYYQNTTAGSGGGIRVITETLIGTGTLSAVAGVGGTHFSGNGRIRLERVTNTNTISVLPAPSIVDLAAGTTALLWPPISAPQVKILSLGGQPAPADPKSEFGTIGADVSIPSTTTTPAIIETTNVEQASQVKVRITPRDTYNFTEVDATYVSTVSSSPLVIRWEATLPTNLGYSAVQVKVIRP